MPRPLSIVLVGALLALSQPAAMASAQGIDRAATAAPWVVPAGDDGFRRHFRGFDRGFGGHNRGFGARQRDLQDRTLPLRCLRHVRGRYGLVQIFGARCLYASMSGARYLPRYCERRAVIHGRYHPVYVASCLLRRGFRIAV